MIAIIGATGNIGKTIVQELLKKGKRVRAIARNSQRLKELEALGAEIASGTVEDADFLTAAFRNATAVFAMNAPNEQAQNLREYQKKISDAIGSALKKSTVSHIVNLSSVGGELEAGTGPIAGLNYQESRLNQLEKAHVLHLRPTYFMENFLHDIPVIQGMGVHGTPLRADLSMGIIATVDIGMVAAEALANLNFKGRN
ncbi:SDR family NAD(P)-dependent oxidoreductase, partial [bacterium]|nr:SDR family NAD(P)-dependent oxidoreductase [bacterium]